MPIEMPKNSRRRVSSRHFLQSLPGFARLIWAHLVGGMAGIGAIGESF